MIWDKIKEKINETFKSDTNSEKQDKAKVFQTTDKLDKTKKNVEKEKTVLVYNPLSQRTFFKNPETDSYIDGKIEISDEKTSDKEKAPCLVPYAPFIKHIAEKSGLGDAEDFQKRINAINKFVDNKEAHLNAQRLSSIQKVKDIKNGKTDFMHGAASPDIAIKNWQGGADIAEEMLKNEGLKIYTPEELDKAFMNGKYLTGKEGVDAANDALKATSEFSKKGQKVPFKNSNISEYPRQGVAKATKKFNLLKKTIDVLSNPKLNAALGLLLTPTPLYEPSIEDIRRRNGISDKLYFSLEETEQPSDNQTE